MKYILKIILISVLFFGCKKETNSNSNQTDLSIESIDIDNFFKSNPENKNIVKEVNLFYKNRNFQYAWFSKKGMTQAVSNFQNQLQNYCKDFNDQSFKNEQLDTLVTLIKTNLNESSINPKQRENLELLLTTTFFKYSEKRLEEIERIFPC